MAYRENQRELKQAAQRMENHEADYHPEMAGKTGVIKNPDRLGDLEPAIIEHKQNRE